MNLFKLSTAYLLHKKLHTFLSILIMSLGMLLITLLLIINHQLRQTLEKNIANVDMAIGAKGSPMQIILSSLFHIDFPTGNISLDDAEFISGHRLVKKSVPLSIGDSYSGYRIIGTDSTYFSYFELKINEGKWPENEMEVILGSNVATEFNLHLYETFESSHGFSDDSGHENLPYRIVGILEKSNLPQDNLIFTPLTSYWHVHETDTSKLFITNLLLQFRNPMAAVQLPRMVNSTSNLQAALPSFEITKLFSMLGIGSRFLNILAFLLVGISALSIFISMYSSLNDRIYDMAIMRAIGATRQKLFTFILLEGIIISSIGAVLGITSAHLVIVLLQQLFPVKFGFALSGLTVVPKEWLILILGIASGIFGAIIPAIQIYRSDISEVLSEN